MRFKCLNSGELIDSDEEILWANINEVIAAVRDTYIDAIDRDLADSKGISFKTNQVNTEDRPFTLFDGIYWGLERV